MSHEPELRTPISAPNESADRDEMPEARRPAKGFGQFRESADKNVLFGTSADAPRIIEVEVAAVALNPDQPRKHFDPERLRELADSIRYNGLVQPITVTSTETPGQYQLVAGERRLRAHQILGRETIYAIQTDGDPEVIALIENIQREQLDPLEEADAYAQMMERHGYSQAELGQVVGKKQNTISEALSLRRLSPALVEQYRTSDTRLSKNALVEIAKESDDERQAELLRSALDGGLGVRALRAQRKAPSPALSGKTSQAQAAGARKDRLIRSLHATVKRLAEDGRAEDFPAGSEALERVRELRGQLSEHLDRITEQGRLTEDS